MASAQEQPSESGGRSTHHRGAVRKQRMTSASTQESLTEEGNDAEPDSSSRGKSHGQEKSRRSSAKEGKGTRQSTAGSDRSSSTKKNAADAGKRSKPKSLKYRNLAEREAGDTLISLNQATEQLAASFSSKIDQLLQNKKNQTEIACKAFIEQIERELAEKRAFVESMEAFARNSATQSEGARRQLWLEDELENWMVEVAKLEMICHSYRQAVTRWRETCDYPSQENPLLGEVLNATRSQNKRFSVALERPNPSMRATLLDARIFGSTGIDPDLWSNRPATTGFGSSIGSRHCGTWGDETRRPVSQGPTLGSHASPSRSPRSPRSVSSKTHAASGCLSMDGFAGATCTWKSPGSPAIASSKFLATSRPSTSGLHPNSARGKVDCTNWIAAASSPLRSAQGSGDRKTSELESSDRPCLEVERGYREEIAKLEGLLQEKRQQNQEKKARLASCYRTESEIEEFFLRCVDDLKQSVSRDRILRASQAQPTRSQELLDFVLCSEKTLAAIYEKIIPRRRVNQRLETASGAFQGTHELVVDPRSPGQTSPASMVACLSNRDAQRSSEMSHTLSASMAAPLTASATSVASGTTLAEAPTLRLPLTSSSPRSGHLTR